jgi:thiamine-monophosphate kinase
LPKSSEDRLLSWLRGRIARSAAAGTAPLLGDDAAVLPARSFAVTVDSQIAGVHFPPDLPAAVLARRLLAVNLSDLAATGAEPAYAFLALSAASGFDHRRFFNAFLAACERFGVELAGGDLARQPQATTITLTLLGTRPRGGRFLTRGKARPGDALWLSGTVGESAAGRFVIARGARFDGRSVRLPLELDIPGMRRAARGAVRRHLLPEPHLAIGRWLGRQRRAAAIDLSDGLALDLSRLARESGVGAEVNAADLPLADRFAALCQAIDHAPLELALGGGEDYVLLFAISPQLVPPASFGCTRIGTITEGRRLRLLKQDGQTVPLPVLGWDHLAPG